MIQRRISAIEAVLGMSFACVTLAGCAPYETRPLDDPEIPTAVLIISNLPTLELRGVSVVIEAVDGEPAYDNERAVVYPGARIIRVSETLTGLLAQRGVRVPLRTCDATLEFVAQAGRRYRVVAEDTWESNASLKIIDDKGAAVTASKVCNPRQAEAIAATAAGFLGPARSS